MRLHDAIPSEAKLSQVGWALRGGGGGGGVGGGGGGVGGGTPVMTVRLTV